MASSTTPFALHTFPDLLNAVYSGAPVSREALRNRLLYIRTLNGNFARLHVQAGDNLVIRGIVLYNPKGRILLVEQNIIIQANQSCNIDTATVTTDDADIIWMANENGQGQLVIAKSAGIHVCPEIESITFDEINSAKFNTEPIRAAWLSEQILFAKSNQGRLIKMLVHANKDLIIRRLIVYNSDATVHKDLSNIIIPPTHTLDLDTAQPVKTKFDLWWQAVDHERSFLHPLSGAAIAFDGYDTFSKYLNLLEHPAISKALQISGKSDREYSDWTLLEKYTLYEYLFLLETGKPLPLEGPPVVTNEGYMPASEALSIYLAHVAHSLWVDANNLVPWKLADADAQTLALLLNMNKMFAFNATFGYRFDTPVMGSITMWNPALAYQFLQQNKFVGSDHFTTICALSDWVRAHLNHIATFGSAVLGGPFASAVEQLDFYFQYQWFPPVEKMFDPIPGRPHITTGCHCTTGFFAAVLRTVNIPVQANISMLNDLPHSRTSFISIKKHFAHGDSPYDAYIRLGINNVPIERVLYTDEEIQNSILAPIPMPGKTIGETATFNLTKRSVHLALEFMTNYILRMRCEDKASGFSSGENSVLWQNLHPFFTDPEITNIAALIDTAIAKIPGGCEEIQ